MSKQSKATSGTIISLSPLSEQMQGDQTLKSINCLPARSFTFICSFAHFALQALFAPFESSLSRTLVSDRSLNGSQRRADRQNRTGGQQLSIELFERLMLQRLLAQLSVC